MPRSFSQPVSDRPIGLRGYGVDQLFFLTVSANKRPARAIRICIPRRLRRRSVLTPAPIVCNSTARQYVVQFSKYLLMEETDQKNISLLAGLHGVDVYK